MSAEVKKIDTDTMEAVQFLYTLLLDVDDGYIDLGSSDLDIEEVRAFLGRFGIIGSKG